MHSLDPVWEAVKGQFEAARSEAGQTARAQTLNDLNQLLRRFRKYGSESEWISAILDGAANFARQVALFTLQDGVLHLRGQRNLDLAEDLSFSAARAAAFQSAISSKDTIVALRSYAEIGESLSSPNHHERAYVVPVVNGSRVVALLFAPEQDSVDLNGIELIAGVASTVLERQSNTSLHTQIGIHPTKATSNRDERKSGAPCWADLSDDQRLLHIRAQRFARVKVAEMQVSKPDACHAGRQQGNVYVFLRQEIDKARDAYRKQFMTVPSMVDYLHLELVRTAAEGDEQKLGADYPGQLA